VALTGDYGEATAINQLGRQLQSETLTLMPVLSVAQGCVSASVSIRVASPRVATEQRSRQWTRLAGYRRGLPADGRQTVLGSVDDRHPSSPSPAWTVRGRTEKPHSPLSRTDPVGLRRSSPGLRASNGPPDAYEPRGRAMRRLNLRRSTASARRRYCAPR
jgi:hypothetical protein